MDTLAFALRRAFPNKRYADITHAGRLAILGQRTAGQPRFAVAVTEGGLFVEMARELRQSVLAWKSD